MSSRSRGSFLLLVLVSATGCGASTRTGFGCLIGGRIVYDDACPRTDRDEDGVPDHLDAAPLIPEDLDGVQDQDGVPEREAPKAKAETKGPEGPEAGAEAAPEPTQTADDYSDVDGDGVYDAYDLCPDLGEDPDGFADGDGCPELDNDDDGIPDETDLCPEDFGEICGDTLDLGAVVFRPDSGKLAVNKSPGIEAILRLLPNLAPDVVVDILCYADTEDLARSQGDRIKRYLVRRGHDAERLFVRGLAAKGAANRPGRAPGGRVEFRLHRP